MIKINFDETFSLLRVKIDRNICITEFKSPLRGGDLALIRVIIQPHPDPLLLKVYNLAMGPPVGVAEIDDNIRLRHSDSNRVFSTAILFALTFLTEYPEMVIGLDGTDDIRATLYHSMFKANKENLNEYFEAIGVDWYVKLLRNQVDIERTENGSPFFKPRPERFDYSRNRHDLYRYYMFELK